jgi:heme-degrading monooxygenase HmoA
MIARIWRGWTSADDADAYVAYVEETGIKEYRAIPGNQGAWILRRVQGDRAEILTLSFWDSLDAIREFAGEDVEQAVFYPDDDRYLVERELRVAHYEIQTVAT